jgi:hypothetical protein
MVKLGDRAKDVISGFSGIVTGRAVYLNGCVHILINSQSLGDKGEPKSEWFDEPRVKLIRAGAFQAQQSTATAGGPVSNPAPKH